MFSKNVAKGASPSNLHLCSWILLYLIHSVNGQKPSSRPEQMVKKDVAVGIVFPKEEGPFFFVKKIFEVGSKNEMKGDVPRTLLNRYTLRNVTTFLGPERDPLALLNLLCDQMIKEHVVAIIFLSHFENYISTAQTQYFMHLTSYTGIPVIAWNADNSGLLTNRDLNKYRLLQMAPTMEHQVQAMMQIIARYEWKNFVAVTTDIPGHNQFVELCQKVGLDKSIKMVEEFQLDVNNETALNEQLERLKTSESRIFLLYATYEEAAVIFEAAEKHSLNGAKYMWIATQSVVKNPKTAENGRTNFPVGMMATSFDTFGQGDHPETNVVMHHLRNAFKVFKIAVNDFLSLNNYTIDFVSTSNCDSDFNYTWPLGDEFYKHLKKVSFTGVTGVPEYPTIPISFDEDGFVKECYLSILNLRPDRSWEKIGHFTKGKVTIKDIAWPGGMLKPPQGIPEKYHLKIVTLEEMPFVIVGEIDPLTNDCPSKQGVVCHWGTKDNSKPNETNFWNRNNTIKKCCTGFTVDLLKKLSEEMQFDFDLYKVPDGLWGAKINNRWNGLVAELVENNADLCVTALKINSEREKDIDFSVPFLETGITILVAYRGGALSPTAFLEPFEYNTWVFILVVSIFAAAVAIFLFEWLSPESYDCKMEPPPGHKFSLFRSYWLVWATLFSASVNTDVPKSHTARFMALVWAAFSLTFLAIYTANLAAFMITRTEFYDLSGIDDSRIQSPKMSQPPFRFGTVRSGNTEVTLRVNYPNLHRYMTLNDFFKPNISEGIKAVKNGDYHAFIYDSVVLQYLAGKDDNCQIGTVGKWFSMTGYGIGLPKKSPWLKQINKYLLKFQGNGDLERLQNFWLTGACSPKGRDKQNHSSPLGIENFVSAFALLVVGIVICLLLICLEYFYCHYFRQRLKSCNKSGWCGLISLSMARSLSFKEAVARAHSEYKMEKTKSTKFVSLREKLLEKQLQKAIAELQRLKHGEELEQEPPVDCAPERNTVDDSIGPSLSFHTPIMCSQIETVI